MFLLQKTLYEIIVYPITKKIIRTIMHYEKENRIHIDELYINEKKVYLEIDNNVIKLLSLDNVLIDLIEL